MTQGRFLFTSESVTEGHPDKLCDQISDGVLDAIIAKDPTARVACETMATTGLVVVAGEITTKAHVEFPKVIRQIIKDIGYTDASYGLDYNSCGVMVAIDEQSPDIAMGVNSSEVKEQGAGDQGMMFGYASNESPELMPLAIILSHRLTGRLAQKRKDGSLTFLRPDGKSQVTVEYIDGKPARIDTVVIAAQHSPDIDPEELRQAILEEIIIPCLPEELLDFGNFKYFINPTGRFVVGGPQGDCGLTGRKIMVDTYGGLGRHGGGCFSGKDPSKVDRTGAYMARYAAKNIVAAGLADKCEVQVAYAIGVARPVSTMVNSFGTGKLPDHELAKIVEEVFDFKPSQMVKHLNLLRPIYRKTAAYGHFGRDDADFTWERVDMVDALKSAAKL